MGATGSGGTSLLVEGSGSADLRLRLLEVDAASTTTGAGGAALGEAADGDD